MAWAFWLAVPVVATSVAAVLIWLTARRARPSGRPDTAAAMRAHQDYLDALAVPARGSYRVPPGEFSPRP